MKVWKIVKKMLPFFGTWVAQNTRVFSRWSTRAARADAAKKATAAEVTDKQQAFVEFVLGQYIAQGTDELDQEQLSPLLRLKYRALDDAFNELGRPDRVRKVFVGFQRHLYER
jgi:type I restriction enzyme R subunit